MSLMAGLKSSASPASLFANGEVGVWYDPSDLTTLFQDSAGTTPVTAAGQQVGLVLDKSQGATLGPELVTNGNFSSGTTGWTGVNATISVVSGALRITCISGTPYAYTAITTQVGKTYLLNVTLVADAMLGNSFVYAGTTVGSGNIANRNIGSTVGKYVVVFTATTTTTYISLSGTSSALATQTFDWDNISCKLTTGNPATQTVDTQRPIYQVDETGRPYLLFDGVDDWLITPTITPATDKVQVFAGVRKLSDAAVGNLLELSTNTGILEGTLRLTAPGGTGTATYSFSSKGTVLASISASTYASPITNVVTATGDISGDLTILRANGTQFQSTGDQGTGNFLAYPLYIARRAGTSVPYNGRLYSLIVRFGSNLTTGQITATETWVNGETGAY